MRGPGRARPSRGARLAAWRSRARARAPRFQRSLSPVSFPLSLARRRAARAQASAAIPAFEEAGVATARDLAKLELGPTSTRRDG